jgi:hypothetical protein
MKNAKRGGRPTSGSNVPPSGRVAPPSSSFRQFTEGDVFRVSVPSNWNELPSSDSVTFAPSGAYGSYNGQSVFTHGVQFGVSRNENHPLQEATDELIDSLRQGNPRMGQPTRPSNTTLGARRALQTGVTNVSEATGEEETIQIVTALLPNGDLLYGVFVVPTSDWPAYRNVFQRVSNSVRLIQ